MADEQRVVLVAADGSVAAQVFVPAGSTATASGNNPAGLREVNVARFGDMILEKFDAATATWATDLDKLKAMLVTQVKLDNEALVRTLYSTNYGKQKKYSRKQQEVMDFRALASALTPVSTLLTQSLSVIAPAFDALSAAAQKKKFRFAMAEAAKRGVAVATVIGEFEAAIEYVESQVASNEATEQDAVRRIKAATTPAAARAAAAAVDWTFRAP